MAIRPDSATLDPDAGTGPRPWVLGDDGELALDKADLSAPDHFAVLGLPRRLRLDPAHLDIRVRSLVRSLHPDRFHLQGPAAVAQAQRHTALVNDAYRTLREFDRRVSYLLALEAESVDEKFRPPPALLAQVFEWNEAVDGMQEALRSGTPAKVVPAERALVSALAEIGRERADVRAQLDAAAVEFDAASNADTDAEAIAAARRSLRAALGHGQYLDNLLERLDQAAARPEL